MDLNSLWLTPTERLRVKPMPYVCGPGGPWSTSEHGKPQEETGHLRVQQGFLSEPESDRSWLKQRHHFREKRREERGWEGGAGGTAFQHALASSLQALKSFKLPWAGHRAHGSLSPQPISTSMPMATPHTRVSIYLLDRGVGRGLAQNKDQTPRLLGCPTAFLRKSPTPSAILSEDKIN